MRKWFSGALALGMICTGLLSGCGTAQEASTIVVGATPTPQAEILQVARELLEQQGYTLKIIEFTDYVQPNLALAEGALDANYYQHEPYLENFNQEHDGDLQSAGAVHYELFGLYPGKADSLDALPSGATITIPNDATNETRALLLLQEQGLIRLAEHVDVTVKATVLDIVENPRKLEIIEMESVQLARSLQDAHMSVINGNYALQAGLSASRDAIAIESEETAGVYANIVAARQPQQEKIQALMEALRSDAVRTFIADTYEGTVVPVF